MSLIRCACGTLIAASILTSGAAAQPNLHGALLPSSRTVATDAPATAFFTVLNSGDTTATNCSIQTSTVVGSSLDEFTIATQRTASAVGVGPLNPSFSIAPDERIDFVVGVTRNAGSFLSDAFVDLYVECDSEVFSLAWPMLTRFHAQFRDDAPDIIMITQTVTGDGIATYGPQGRPVVAVAAVNIGAADPVTDGLSAPNAGDTSVSARVTMPHGQYESIYDAEVCETDGTGQCVGTPGECVVDGRDECLSTSIGDTASTFRFSWGANEPPSEQAFIAFNRVSLDFESPTAFSQSSTTIARGSNEAMDIGFGDPDRLTGPHFQATFRNTDDPTGRTLVSGPAAFNSEGTGVVQITRAVDRGAFVQLEDQTALIDITHDPRTNALDISRLIFLDSREGDDSRPNPYYAVSGSSLTCNLTPEEGGTCLATAGSTEQIAGEPALFDAGRPFRMILTPAAMVARAESLVDLAKVWSTLVLDDVYAPGFTTVESSSRAESYQSGSYPQALK
jgi:hypothetical protein